MAENSSNDGVKAFGGIAMLLALAGGVAAIMRPMHLQIEAIQNELAEHVSQREHPAVQTEAISNLKREQDKIREALSRRLSDYDPVQDERIRALEREVYKNAP